MTRDVFGEPRARVSRFLTDPNGLSFRTSRRFSSDGAGDLRHKGAKSGDSTQLGIRATFLRRVFRRWMSSLFVTQVREETERWLKEYNTVRPHESLGDVSPIKFLTDRGHAEVSSYDWT